MPEPLKRAYALIEAKAYDDEKRVITGIATSARVDRMGDVIEMDGVKVARDIPLFLYHDSTKIVGRAKLGEPEKKGIPFEAMLPKVVDVGALRDRVEEAWQMVRHGLITAVSIGFRPMNDAYEMIKDGGIRFLEIEILELSLVPVPAQPDAVINGMKSADPAVRESVIEAIKSADQAARRAAHGARSARLSRPTPAAKSGQPDASGKHPYATFLFPE